jgi:hypothetical protein
MRSDWIEPQPDKCVVGVWNTVHARLNQRLSISVGGMSALCTVSGRT